VKASSLSFWSSICLITSVISLGLCQTAIAGNRLPFDSGTSLQAKTYPDHKGIDFISGPNVRARAYRDGVIYSIRYNEGSRGACIFAGTPNAGFGNVVRLKHSDGTYSIYAHLESINPNLRENQPVSQGDEIGVIGTTGCSNTRHLHFQASYEPTGGSTNYFLPTFDESNGSQLTFGNFYTSQNTGSMFTNGARISLQLSATPSNGIKQCAVVDGTKIGILPNANRFSVGPCQNIQEYRYSTLRSTNNHFLIQLEASPPSGAKYCLEVNGTKIGVLPNANAIWLSPCREIQEQKWRTIDVGQNMFMLQLEAAPPNGVKQCAVVDGTKIGSLANAQLGWVGPCQNIQEYRWSIIPR
jgi:hypothetical protein